MQRSIICSECNKAQTIITDPQSGQIICGSCGLVVLNKIPVRGPELGTFITDGGIVHNRSRMGIPSSLARYDMGLSTIIGWTNKDSSGHRLNEAMHSRMLRLRTWDSRIHLHTSAEKSLKEAFNELDSFLPLSLISLVQRSIRTISLLGSHPTS